MAVSEGTYLQLALEDKEGQWELVDGWLRSKAGDNAIHNHVMTHLAFAVMNGLGSDGRSGCEDFEVRINSARIRIRQRTFLMPDVLVATAEQAAPLWDQEVLEHYTTPVPFVAEVWSVLTGDDEVEPKLDEYRQHGEHEIWRLRTDNREVTAWRRQPDGSYTETYYQGGRVPIQSLPSVTIDIDSLFFR